MGVLLDTSVVIAFERDSEGMPGLLARIDEQPAAIASITASELLHGVHRADTAQRRAKRERYVEEIFSTAVVLPLDLAVARIHARLWADLASAGRLLAAHDLIIGATALAHELPLATLDVQGFGRIEGLELVSV